MGMKSRKSPEDYFVVDEPDRLVADGIKTIIDRAYVLYRFITMFEERALANSIDIDSPIRYLTSAATICDVFFVDLFAGDIVIYIDSTSPQSFRAKVEIAVASGWFPEIVRVTSAMKRHGHTMACVLKGAAMATSIEGDGAALIRKEFDAAVEIL